MKASICAALEMRRREAWPPTYRYSYPYGVEPPARVRVQPELGRRALSDETLNTIEDYNKMIGATEAIVSGSIAMTAA